MNDVTVDRGETKHLVTIAIWKIQRILKLYPMTPLISKTMFSQLNQMMIVSGGIVVSKNAQEMDIVRPKD